MKAFIAGHRLLVLTCFASCVLFHARAAHARRSGLAAAGCEGCHTGGKAPKVTITTEPAVFGPGDTVTASVIIQAVNGGPGGLYFTADIGRFTGIAGAGTTLVSDTELTHNAPKAASGGNVVFQVRWTAPAEANAVYFETWALSSNGNGSASGDGAGHALSTVLFGCAGSPYYIDLDGDGFGDQAGAMLIKCASTPGFSSQAGDCDDNNREIHPGAPERCNSKDDNCDGRSDEGLTSGAQKLYVDQDGDGYGVASAPTLTVTGCTTMSGYAALFGDCDDRDAKIHPGAADICNLLDDNCDGHIDEQARPRCGKGWCERLSSSCDPAACVPGQPTSEVCNGADDDCDGFIDDAPNLCAAGLECRLGICAAASDVGTGGAGFGGQQGSGGADHQAGGALQTGGGASAEGGRAAAGAAIGGTSGGASGAGGTPSGGQTLPVAGEGGERAAGCALRAGACRRWNSAAHLALVTVLAAWLVRRRRAASRQR